MVIYHNPRCRKSRETLQIIKEKGIEPEIVEYLKEPPTNSELKELLRKLGISAEELIRKNEAIYKEKFKGKQHSEAEWIEILKQHPKLIERPIVVKGEKAVIGRPPENVYTLIG